MARIGLVLGGGGITGAAFHFGALLALRMATGWDPDAAEVVVGTSAGAFVTAMVRGGALRLGTMIGDGESRESAEAWLRAHLYRPSSHRSQGVLRWLRRGVLPGLRRPDLGLVLGSPGLYRTDGIEEWVAATLGPAAETWPSRPTVVVAYDLVARRRVAFGTEAAPEVPLRRAVAASSAVPFVYEPVRIDDRWYVDGGVASGTHADLVLGSPEPLDLVIVVAPMAALDGRPGVRFHEDIFDRVGRRALRAELERIRRAWPATDVVVLRPDARVLRVARPNPMSIDAAIPSFLATLRSMRDELASPGTWSVLEHHLPARPAPGT